MPENENSLLPSASKLPNELYLEIYKDGAKPGVQKVGKALGNVLGLFNSMTLFIERFNVRKQLEHEVFLKNMERLREKMDEIPEDKVCEVHPEIGVPVIERLTFTVSEELREAFIQLLKRASSSDTAQLAHPAFVSIIQRLSSDEALLLRAIYSEHGDWPYLTVSIMGDRTRLIATVRKWLTGIGSVAKLSFPKNINLYFENLKSLSLIDFRATFLTYDINEANPIAYSHSFHEDMITLQATLGISANFEADLTGKIQKPNDFELLYEQGELLKTEFGMLFMQACTTVLEDREERDSTNFGKWFDDYKRGLV